jgi:hypothetical protein
MTIFNSKLETNAREFSGKKTNQTEEMLPKSKLTALDLTGNGRGSLSSCWAVGAFLKMIKP